MEAKKEKIAAWDDSDEDEALMECANQVERSLEHAAMTKIALVVTYTNSVGWNRFGFRWTPIDTPGTEEIMRQFDLLSDMSWGRVRGGEYTVPKGYKSTATRLLKAIDGWTIGTFVGKFKVPPKHQIVRMATVEDLVDPFYDVPSDGEEYDDV